jgi:hypothetical protein
MPPSLSQSVGTMDTVFWRPNLPPESFIHHFVLLLTGRIMGRKHKKLCHQPSGTCLIGCFHQMFVCRVRDKMLSFVREKDDHIKPTPRKPEFRLRSSEGCEQRITPCDSGMALYLFSDRQYAQPQRSELRRWVINQHQ